MSGPPGTRDRAGTLMSAATVASGLGVGLAFNSGEAHRITSLGAGGALLALTGFVAVAVTTVLIWRPTEARFLHDAGVIIGSYVEGDPPRGLPEIHRELALWFGQRAESNRAILERDLRTFTIGLGALLVEIAGFILVFGDIANG